MLRQLLPLAAAAVFAMPATAMAGDDASEPQPNRPQYGVFLGTGVELWGITQSLSLEGPTWRVDVIGRLLAGMIGGGGTVGVTGNLFVDDPLYVTGGVHYGEWADSGSAWGTWGRPIARIAIGDLGVGLALARHSHWVRWCPELHVLLPSQKTLDFVTNTWEYAPTVTVGLRLLLGYAQ